jgi:predicted HTH domain antitoxin
MAKRPPKPIAPARPLARRSARNEPFSKIYIYSEGKLTEPEYIINFYRDLCSKKRVILAPIVRAAGVPLTIVEACVAKRAELRRASRVDSFEKKSEIWAVFDVDEHPRLFDAIALAQGNGINCAISNPCVEVWGLMHFGLYEKPSTRAEAQSELAKVMTGYHHDHSPQLPWDLCKGRVNDAITNSFKAKERREAEGSKFPSCNPSTTFQELLIALQRQ